jgi:hypothetical protein
MFSVLQIALDNSYPNLMQLVQSKVIPDVPVPE